MRFEVWDLGFWDLRIDTVTVYNVSRGFAYSIDGVIWRFALGRSEYSDKNDHNEWSENTGNTDEEGPRTTSGWSQLSLSNDEE